MSKTCDGIDNSGDSEDMSSKRSIDDWFDGKVVNDIGADLMV
jgi:hypothetical protein